MVLINAVQVVLLALLSLTLLPIPIIIPAGVALIVGSLALYMAVKMRGSERLKALVATGLCVVPGILLALALAGSEG